MLCVKVLAEIRHSESLIVITWRTRIGFETTNAHSANRPTINTTNNASVTTWAGCIEVADVVDCPAAVALVVGVSMGKGVSVGWVAVGVSVD